MVPVPTSVKAHDNAPTMSRKPTVALHAINFPDTSVPAAARTLVDCEPDHEFSSNASKGSQGFKMAYGLTETAGPMAIGLHTEAGYQPLPHTECRLCDNELQVRGPTVFAGYWDHPESGLLPDGWLPTG
ncbi:hypothetical protein HPB51_000994 [Rhipicephalus microplus]|uniref:Uncharacterized protein n=1 Tax=Rhipicephalus microplus TaxID=6941 RepID=A0A9J6DEI2_RHIMP|nr:hypothetical protein HPB51_000994 [Rhipicephalus microplus]